MIKADITVVLLPEVTRKNKRHVEREIAKTLRCNWLLKVEKVSISRDSIPDNKMVIHHRMPDGKEVRTYG